MDPLAVIPLTGLFLCLPAACPILLASRKPAEHGVACAGKMARQLTHSDYDKYDFLIEMIRTSSGFYEREVIAEKISNFESRLPSPQSELAIQTMKDPYIFDFIPFREDIQR